MSILSLARHSGGGLGLSPRRRGVKGTTVPAILQDGLVAEWRFDDGAGQQITDYVGGFHAQLGATASVDSGEPTWSATGVDMVERSQAENYVLVGSDLNMDDGSNRTVVVVASADLTDLGGTSFGYGLFNWTNPSETTLGDRWLLTINSNGKLSIGTTFGQQFQHPGSLVSDGWHFFAAVQNGTRHGDVTLHFDGEAPFNDPVWGSDFSNLSGATCFMGSLGSAFGGFKDGRHAYCLVYNRALSDAEIAHNRMALAAILAGRAIMLP